MADPITDELTALRTALQSIASAPAAYTDQPCDQDDLHYIQGVKEGMEYAAIMAREALQNE